MRFRYLVSAVTLCCVRASAAQVEPKPAPPAEQLPAIFAPRPASRPAPKLPPPRRPGAGASAPQSRRAISPELASKLAEVGRRAAPPAQAAQVGGPDAPSAVGSSDAVQLDPFVVQEEKFPEFKERSMLTPEGKRALAQKLNPGLKAGALPLGNNAVALEMLEEVFAQQRRTELAELNSVLKAGDKKVPPELQRKIDEAATRNNEWSRQIGTPFREPR